MSSYADIAAKNSEQSPEEARAAPVPGLSHDESAASSLIDVDSPHVSSVKSDFETQSVQTDTQADRIQREAEDAAERARQKASKEAATAKEKAKKAKATLKKDGQKLAENKDNPVVIGNAILWGLTVAAVGYGAYQKQQEGKLDWKLAGGVAAGLGALAVGDYYASQWLLENKYPPK